MSFSTNSRNDSVKRLTERVYSPDCSDILFVRRHDEQKDTAKSGTALLRNPAFVASKKKILVLRHFRRIVVVHHPVDAEFVGPHPEIGAPKRVCKRHCNGSAFRKSFEQTLCFFA